jgi:molecular chaperone GrpE
MSLFHRNMKKDEESSNEAEKESTRTPVENPNVDEISDALAQLARERDDYIARWQRAQADFQNLRRRTQSDIDAAVRRSQQGLLEGILLSLDQLELALAAPRSGAQAAQLARGVEMTRSELMRTLAAAGVQPMSALKPGDRFDPTLHQAVASIPSEDAKAGTIIEVVRVGYSWGEIVLRPAQVVVAAAQQSPESSASDEER